MQLNDFVHKNDVRGAVAFVYDVSITGDGYTGVYRPLAPGDFGSISLSGASLSVGSVAITGNPLVTVSNPTPSGATTPTVLAIASNASAILLTGSNAARLGLSFYNNATTPVYLRWGSGVSASSFSFILQSGDYYEMPGRITAALYAVWQDTPTGSGMLTEIV